MQIALTQGKKLLLLLSEPCPSSHISESCHGAAQLPGCCGGTHKAASASPAPLPSPLRMRGAGSPGDLPGQEGSEGHPLEFENIKTSEAVGSIDGHYSHCNLCTLKPLDTVDPYNQAFRDF